MRPPDQSLEKADRFMVTTSFVQWLWQLFVAMLGVIMFTMFGTLIFGMALPSMFGAPLSLPSPALTIFLLVTIPVLSLRYMVNKELRYIALEEEHIRLGGLLFSRIRTYDQLLLLCAPDCSETSRSLVQTEIYMSSGGQLVMWIRQCELAALAEELHWRTGRPVLCRQSDWGDFDEGEEDGEPVTELVDRSDAETVIWQQHASDMMRRRTLSFLIGVVFFIPSAISLWQVLNQGFTTQQLASLMLFLALSAAGWLVGAFCLVQLKRNDKAPEDEHPAQY